MLVLGFFSVLAAAMVLSYKRASIEVWTVSVIVGLLLLFHYSNSLFLVSTLSVFSALVLTLLNVKSLRQRLVSKRLLTLFKKEMPSMSKTEAEALEAGTVSFEGEIFSGNPELKAFLEEPLSELSEDEKAFLEGPVKTLLSMFNEWDVTHHHTDLPPKVWQYIKDQGFLGMIIPKQYGGLEFSATGQRAVLVSIFSKSVSAGTTICVPNSLGPAELLLKYGTDKQKEYYLPRLAKGLDIPCFALTNPNAGSDAASIPDEGVVCKGTYQGKEVVGIKLNWDKRYITLSPVATVIGLAFRLFDPEGLLGQEEDLGITCALIPRKTAGIKIGRRHFPLNTAFLNGPIHGKDVFISLEQVIGGEKMVGQGWRMLMECLSAGRAISLPSTAVGGGHVATLATGAYAKVRKQFNTSIGNFEGIQEALARVGGYSYIIDNALTVTTSLIDKGAKPAVLSAILKYHSTELARKISIDAMDIHGGKGICLGPNNYLGRGYQNAPISITVEGANILTRCLIIFGQGAIRCHPYVLNEMKSVEKGDVQAFDKAFFAHVGFFISNFVRSFILGITNGYQFSNRKEGELASPLNAISRYSAQFAFLSDYCMIKFGASLKRKEMISARLGDLLSYLYLASSTVKCYHANGRPSDEKAAMQWASQTLFYELECQMEELIENIGGRFSKRLLKIVLMPFGKRRSKPNDQLVKTLAKQLTTDNDFRDRLTRFAYKEDNSLNPVGRLEVAFKKIIHVEGLEKRLLTFVKEGSITKLTQQEQIDEAFAKGLIEQEEAELLTDAENLRQEVIKVDDFSHQELTRELNPVKEESELPEPSLSAVANDSSTS